MLRVQKIDQRAKTPTVAHKGSDLCWDVYALEDYKLEPHKVVSVRTGIACEFDDELRGAGWHKEYGLVLRPRSSMGKKGVVVMGGECHAGYRGEIIVMLCLVAPEMTVGFWSGPQYVASQGIAIDIKAGDKVAQMRPVLVLTGHDVVEVSSLSDSERGAKGFGSSGR